MCMRIPISPPPQEHVSSAVFWITAHPAAAGSRCHLLPSGSQPILCSRLTVSPAVLWIIAHPAAASSQCGFDVYLGWWPRLHPFSSNSWLFVVMPSLEKILFRFTAYFSLFNFCLLCYWVAFDLLSKSLHFREQIKSLKHRGLPQTNN